MFFSFFICDTTGSKRYIKKKRKRRKLIERPNKYFWCKSDSGKDCSSEKSEEEMSSKLSKELLHDHCYFRESLESTCNKLLSERRKRKKKSFNMNAQKGHVLDMSKEGDEGIDILYVERTPEKALEDGDHMRQRHRSPEIDINNQDECARNECNIENSICNDNCSTGQDCAVLSIHNQDVCAITHDHAYSTDSSTCNDDSSACEDSVYDSSDVLLIQKCRVKFWESIEKAPDYVCSVCHRLLFKTSCQLLHVQNYKDKIHSELFGKVFSYQYKCHDGNFYISLGLPKRTDAV